MTRDLAAPTRRRPAVLVLVRRRRRAAERDRARFGPVLGHHPFGLTSRELAVEVRRCETDGWQRWEIGARFGSWWAA